MNIIWLIGNKGMLGTEVEALLKQQRHTYIATDQEVDITNPDRLKEFAADKPITWIINCAAYTAVDRAEDEPAPAYKINADGPLNIAQIAKSIQAKLIHISTDYVFDGTKLDAYEETDVPAPLGVYGKSKYQGEQNITRCLPEHFILRTAWLYGKHGPNFVYTMLRLMGEKSELSVVADQWGSPTYAPDLAEVIVTIINNAPLAYGIYHFTNEGRINWHQFASAIYELAKKKGLIKKDVGIVPISTDKYPTKARRPMYAYLSKEKIARNLAIPLKSWHESLAAFISTF